MCLMMRSERFGGAQMAGMMAAGGQEKAVRTKGDRLRGNGEKPRDSCVVPWSSHGACHWPSSGYCQSTHHPICIAVRDAASSESIGASSHPIPFSTPVGLFTHNASIASRVIVVFEAHTDRSIRFDRLMEACKLNFAPKKDELIPETHLRATR